MPESDNMSEIAQLINVMRDQQQQQLLQQEKHHAEQMEVHHAVQINWDS